MLVAGLYLLTEPSVPTAILLLRVFTACRYVHTVSYLNGLQPWRALGYLIGQGIMAYMLYQVICTFW